MHRPGFGRAELPEIPAIISAAEITAADAIHPGYGFLSESVKFAQVVEKCGLNFIGPSSEAMAIWGDKLRAREAAQRFGLPLLLGSVALANAEHAESEATRVGFPVMIKARGGGGGRGMRIVRNVGEVRRAFESATAEATNAFKNPELYLERFVERRVTSNSRHWPTSTVRCGRSASANARCNARIRSWSKNPPVAP